MKPADLELLRKLAQNAARETEKAIVNGLSHAEIKLLVSREERAKRDWLEATKP